MKHALFLCAAVLAAAASPARAEFAVDVDSPHFRVVVPQLPPVKMEEHPAHKEHANLRLIGVEGPWLLTVNTPDADAGMQAQDCANAIAAALPKRPGVPQQDQIVKTRLDANTFAAMYVVPKKGGSLQLNAHLISVASDRHCIEFHAAKIAASKEEAQGWFRSFAGARIETAK